MSRRLAVVLCLLALGLGIGAGRFLLPEGTAALAHLGELLPSKGSQPSAHDPGYPTSGASPRAYARTPPTEEDLVSVAAFDRAGLSVTVYPQNGNSGPGLSVSSCTDERTVGARTLGDITGHDPHLFGTWEEASSSDTANELVGMAESPQEAKVAADRLLAAHTTCQHEPRGHWVYGRTRRQQLHEEAWVAWLGLHPGSQNKTGQVQADADPCGGVAVIRNGQRFGVLEVFMCTDAEQLRTLAMAAATRLG